MAFEPIFTCYFLYNFADNSLTKYLDWKDSKNGTNLFVFKIQL